MPEPSLIPPRVVDKGSVAEELASSGPEEGIKTFLLNKPLRKKLANIRDKGLDFSQRVYLLDMPRC